MAIKLDDFNMIKILVLEEIAAAAFDKAIDQNYAANLGKKMINSLHPSIRCCVYKEREVIRERANLALGKKPDGNEVDENDVQVVHVMEAACDDCDIHKVTITDNCRKCLMRSCEKACKFDAIQMGHDKAHIDYSKCKECGMCVKACGYNAVVTSERPCKKMCPTGALKHVRNEIAVINEAECINCGQCAAACPFKAISEISYITKVIESILSEKETIAIVAPSIQGQYSSATLKQIFTAIKKVGFNDVYEVALGGDMVTYAEAQETVEKYKENKIITTSCCPAFLEFTKKQFPSIYQENTSTVVSPMIALGRYLKKIKPNATIVFVGPCIAKKSEMKKPEVKGVIDYVITFEELLAIFMVKKINPIDMEESESTIPASIYGRRFATAGGVAASVKQMLQEMNEGSDITVLNATGGEEVKKSLTDIKNKKFTANVLEGMVCNGGCNGGVCALTQNPLVQKMRNERENAPLLSTKVKDIEQKIDMSQVNMHYNKVSNQ